MSTLLLVRHGQASAFADDYDQLSPAGEEQARLVGRHLRARELRLACAFTGPRSRQRSTAALAAAAGELPEATVLEELDEMRIEPLVRERLPELLDRHGHLRALGDALFGAPDESARGRAFGRLAEEVLRLWMAGEAHAPDVESWTEFRARATRALAAVRARTPRGATCAVFTSAGPVAAAAQLALGLDDARTLAFTFLVRNASISEFLASEGRFTAMSLNGVGHLPAQLLTLR